MMAGNWKMEGKDRMEVAHHDLPNRVIFHKQQESIHISTCDSVVDRLHQYRLPNK